MIHMLTYTYVYIYILYIYIYIDIELPSSNGYATCCSWSFCATFFWYHLVRTPATTAPGQNLWTCCWHCANVVFVRISNAYGPEKTEGIYHKTWMYRWLDKFRFYVTRYTYIFMVLLGYQRLCIYIYMCVCVFTYYTIIYFDKMIKNSHWMGLDWKKQDSCKLQKKISESFQSVAQVKKTQHPVAQHLSDSHWSIWISNIALENPLYIHIYI